MSVEHDIVTMKMGLIEEIKKSTAGMTQTQAAKIMQITQSRVSNLYNYNVSLFSADTLIKYLILLGKTVSVNVQK